jgi:hypothetical protein
MKAQPTLMSDPVWMRNWEHPLPARDHASGLLESTGNEPTRLPVWLFVSASSGARVLSKVPVEVEIHKAVLDEECSAPGFVFACNKLHVFASAQDYREAEDSFHEQVVHFFYTYRNAKPDDLADDAAAIQALYRRYFEESLAPRD